MSKRGKDDFARYVVEDLLLEMRGVEARGMFGAHGLFRGDAMFGIVVDGTVYFKVGEGNKRAYVEAGSQPFTYEAKNKKRVSMSYWEVPADVLEDREQIARWAEDSLRISLQKKPKKKSKN